MKIKVMFLILCFSFCFANSKDVFASSDQQIDLLLKSEVDIVQVKDIIMQMNPELEITVIPEINLLRISASKDMDIERIFSNDIVKDSIEDSGKLNPIIVEDIGIKNTIIDGALSETRANMSAVEFFDKMAWHVDIITNNRKAIEISNGNGTNIALIDSGVDETHPILENKLNFDNAKSFIEGEEIKDISDRKAILFLMELVCHQQKYLLV